MVKSTKTKDVMTKEVVVANKFHNFSQVIRLFTEYPIHHLPIVDGNNKLIGIVSSNDIMKLFKQPNLQGKPLSAEVLDKEVNIADLMTPEPKTIGPDETIFKAAEIFRQRQFQALPVVDANGELLGILSLKDVLDCFVEMTPETAQ